MDRRISGAPALAEVRPSAAATRPADRVSADQEKLALRIERLIRRQTNDRVRELRVEVLRCQIVLHGRCGTYYCKQVAQQAAMTLVQDKPLVNTIEVW